jgi:hypothetical protein
MPSVFQKKNNNLPASEMSIVGSTVARNRQSNISEVGCGPMKVTLKGSFDWRQESNHVQEEEEELDWLPVQAGQEKIICSRE